MLYQEIKTKENTEKAAEREKEILNSIEQEMNNYGNGTIIEQVKDSKPGELEGSGTETEPYIINSIEDLVFFAWDVRQDNRYEGEFVKLGLSLDFKSDKSYVNPNRTDYGKYGYEGPLKQLLTSGSGYIPIGTEVEPNGFYGTFDGNNHVVSSMYININNEGKALAGLFASSRGVIKNLGIVNADITAEGKDTVIVGGITARSYNNIYNCYTSGNIKATGNHWMPIGGVCGVMESKGNVEECYNLANIQCYNVKETQGNADIGCGGVVGQGKVNMNRCYNKGNLLADGGNNNVSIGGIIGHSTSIGEEQSEIIQNCYNAGTIVSSSDTNLENYVGGVAGGTRTTKVRYCYNVGQISAHHNRAYIGGISGVASVNGQGSCLIDSTINIGEITIKNPQILVAGGIVGDTFGETGNQTTAKINNSYNIGKINIKPKNETCFAGGISASKYGNKFIHDNCYYLKGTCEAGNGDPAGNDNGINELQSISDFPKILEIINGDNAFMEDTNNINNGYPILKGNK